MKNQIQLSEKQSSIVYADHVPLYVKELDIYKVKQIEKSLH